MATDEMNPNVQTNDLLKLLHDDLTGNKNPTNSPNALRFIYCDTNNDTATETLLGKYGLSYQRFSALQSGIYEYQFSSSDTKYTELFNEIVTRGLQMYISNSRLPIQGSIGAITVTATIGDTKVASTDGTSTNIKYLKCASDGTLSLGTITIQDGGNSITIDGTVGITGNVTLNALPTGSNTIGKINVADYGGRTLSTPAVVSINSSANILSANANRKGYRIINQASVNAYIDETGGTASATRYTAILLPNGVLEASIENGNMSLSAITGVVASSTGNVIVTEFT